MGFMSADIGVLFAESPGLFAGAASENTAPLAEATAGMYAALKQAARRKSGSDLEDVAAVCDMCETAISEFSARSPWRNPHECARVVWRFGHWGWLGDA